MSRKIITRDLRSSELRTPELWFGPFRLFISQPTHRLPPHHFPPFLPPSPSQRPPKMINWEQSGKGKDEVRAP